MATAYKEPHVGSKAIKYVQNIELDIKLVFGFTVMTLAFIYFPFLNETIIRPVVGLAMILFVPGYSLIAALFPRKSDISPVERVALSFGLSIAVVPLIGLGLNYTPWGIRLDPIAVCLTFFTIACALIANERRHELPEEERFSVDPAKLFSLAKEMSFADKTTVDRVLTIILITSILVSALMVAYVLITPKPGEKFTEFYILGPDGKADNYPLQFEAGDHKPVIVGIVNHEHRNVTYDLVVVALDDSVNVTTLYSRQVALENNETWEKAVNLTSDKAGTGMKAEFLLFADKNMTAPYRECYLWVKVTSARGSL